MQVLIFCEFGLETPIHTPKIVFMGKIGEEVCDVDPRRTRSYFCATFGENRSRNANVRVRTDRQTDTRNDRDN